MRAVCNGIFDTAGQTFFLLIAVQYFQMGPMGKAALSLNNAPGFILTPLVLALVARWRWPCGLGAGRLQRLGGCLLVGAAFATNGVLFTICCISAMLCFTAGIPLFTQILQENYPNFERGHLFARAALIRTVALLGFSWIGGEILTIQLDWYRWLILLFAAALFTGGTFASRLPSQPYGGSDRNLKPLPTSGWRYLREDRLFRITLISWMFMGLGNLMMLPLRVEYLANPVYGLAMEPSTVALFTGIIPSVARLLFNPFWGRLFDRVDFRMLRIVLNVIFGLALGSFFAGFGLVSLWLGALFFGIAFSGADVMWSLWVTKVAPPDRVASYMSIHTFLTGLRGMAAPFLGFGLLTVLPMQGVMAISLALVTASVLILWPWSGKRTR